MSQRLPKNQNVHHNLNLNVHLIPAAQNLDAIGIFGASYQYGKNQDGNDVKPISGVG
jgi:hypothetical protein